MIRIILNRVGYLLSFIYTRNISKKLNYYINVFYTGWLSRHFMKMEGRIEYPIRLDGAENISIGKTYLSKRMLIKPLGIMCLVKNTPRLLR